MTEREYDVVLYGASGFVGRQTVRYFARHAPAGARWAIAGRDRQKLQAIKTQAGAGAAAVLVADSRDQAAVDAIVSRARVVLNTAGPFALYGNCVVDACVRFKTHYADITGETPWVKDLITRYHDRAASDATRIIPFCGFDSVPSDLGAYLMVRHMQSELGMACEELKAFFQFYGGFNGGTLASGFNVIDSGETARVRDPFLLDPARPHSPEEIERNRDPALPGFDPDVGAWVGPFFMGPINTRVVRRSRALFDQWGAPYGQDFTYQEYIKYGGPLAQMKAAGVTAAVALFEGAMAWAPLRGMLKPLLPRPGSGPSETTMDEGWFRCELLARAADGRTLHGIIRDQGDPGNRATVKLVCESAMALAFDAGVLPGAPKRGGVLTPATGLGEVLADRLRKAGMVIAVPG